MPLISFYSLSLCFDLRYKWGGGGFEGKGEESGLMMRD